MLSSRLARLNCLARRPSTVPTNTATLLPRPLLSIPIHSRGSSRHLFQSRQLRSQNDNPHERLRNARPLVPNAIAGRFTSAGRSRNQRALVVASVVAAIAFYLYNSQTVPVTGRRRFNFLSDALVARAYARGADAIINQVEEQGGRFLSDWDPRTMMVKRVMKRLIPVSGMTDLDWEIRVISDNRKLNTL